MNKLFNQKNKKLLKKDIYIEVNGQENTTKIILFFVKHDIVIGMKKAKTLTLKKCIPFLVIKKGHVFLCNAGCKESKNNVNKGLLRMPKLDGGLTQRMKQQINVI